MRRNPCSSRGVFVGALVLLCVFVAGCAISPEGFSPERWQQPQGDHIQMAEQLLEEQALVGLSRSEVHDLLGEGSLEEWNETTLVRNYGQGPDQLHALIDSVPADGNPSTMEQYYLGMHGIDDAYLMIIYDSDMVVTAGILIM